MPDIEILKFPRQVSFSRNPVPLKLKKNASGIETFVTALLLERNYLTGVYTEVGKFLGEPDSANFAYWDFGGNAETESMLQSCFTGFDIPTYNQSTVTSYAQSIRRFKLRLDYYDTDGVLQNYATIGTPFHALMGGVQWEEFPTAGFWKEYYRDNPMFLSWHPLEKKVNKAQQEFLAYIPIDADITQLVLKVAITIPPFEAEQTIFTTSVSRYKCYQFPVGYMQMGLSTYDPTFAATKYAVWLADQDDNVLTHARVFNIDRSYQPFERYFIFKNSLGGWETLRTTGVAGLNLGHKQTIVQRQWDYRSKAQDGQRYATDILEQAGNKISTGFKSFAEVDFYREMLLSPCVLEDVRGRWVPIEINRKSFIIYKDDDMLFKLEFEYNYRFVNPVYGNKKINSMSGTEAVDDAAYNIDDPPTD